MKKATKILKCIGAIIIASAGASVWVNFVKPFFELDKVISMILLVLGFVSCLVWAIESCKQTVED